MGEAIDTFARENLPAIELWPEIDLAHSAYHYPDRFNCVTRFLDQWIEKGEGDRTALITPTDRWTCLLYTSPSPRDQRGSRMPSSA